MNYVDIVRSFEDIGEESPAPLLRRMRRQWSRPLTWEQLLAKDAAAHVVLVAPSGSGKTTEMQAQARRLRGEGRHAIFASARSIVDHGFEDRLESEEDANALAAWRRTDDRAVIFLDGVDELVIDRRDFRSLIRRMRQLPASLRQNWQLVLSARTGAWTGESYQLLANQTVGGSGNENIREVKFEPLDEQAVRLLAESEGCRDIQGFMDALEEEELCDEIDLRPMDVAPLVRRWNEARTIGPWSRMLEEYQDAALAEVNSDRDRDRELTLDMGRLAARRVGAATLFMKTPFIAVPMGQASNEVVSGRLLFSDWRWRPLSELFESPLFVHKGREAVQLPQGPLPPYLAARWLADRWRGGRDARWLRDQVLVRVYGEMSYALPESRQAMVGWLASEVPAFRALLVEDFPEVVLYRGDPDRLGDDEVIGALERVLVNIRHADEPVWVARRTMRRLARPALEPQVVALLSAESSETARGHLLEWASAGRYSRAVPIATRVAHDEHAASPIRCDAVELVASCGGEVDRQGLLELVSTADERVRAALISDLVPDVLHGERWVELASRGGGDTFKYLFASHISQVGTRDLDDLLERMLPSVQGAERNAETNGHFDVAMIAAIERATRPGPYEEALPRTLHAVERLAACEMRDPPGEQEKKLEQTLAENKVLRRLLWEQRIKRDASGSDAGSCVFGARYGHRSPDDIRWLFGKAMQYPEQRALLVHAIRFIFAAMPAEQRAELLHHCQDLGELVAELRSSEVQEQEAAEATARRADEARKRDAEIRRKHAEALWRIRDQIAAGDHEGALAWAWKPEKDDRGKYSFDLVRLEHLVGPELVPVFVRGYRAFWRKHDVAIPPPGQTQTPVAALAGLAGVGLDCADGLDWTTLTAREATLAATYALYEINGLPVWFPDLLAAQQEVARGVLAQAVGQEWDSTTGGARLLGYAPYEPPSVVRVLRGLAVELLQDRRPASAEVLHAAGDAVLLSSEGAEKVAAGAGAAVSELAKSDDPRLKEWLRLWAHLDPLAVADWFEEELVSSPGSAGRLFVMVAGLLGEDFDEHRSRVAASALFAPSALGRWVRLLMSEVRVEDDLRPTKHMRVLRPRDHARDFRRMCLNRLVGDPTPLARDALIGLTTTGPLAEDKQDAVKLLEAQRRVAAEAAAVPWTEEDVLAVERGDERTPRSMDDLFALVRRHLLDLAAMLESDEFRYTELFTPRTAERELQLWVASSLKHRAGGLYSVVRENVVADDKEVDISAVADGVGQIPIEIKRAALSVKDLEEAISGQLIGRYMTQSDRTKGILLLVHHAPKRWKVGEGCKQLPELVEHLRGVAEAVARPAGKSVAVMVLDIEGNRKG